MTGLPERKKQETRDAPSKAAVQPALERGLNNIRVEDIALYDMRSAPRRWVAFVGELTLRVASQGWARHGASMMPTESSLPEAPNIRMALMSPE